MEDPYRKEEREASIYGAVVQGMLGISCYLHYIHLLCPYVNPVEAGKTPVLYMRNRISW